nr:phosphate ABC transporter permease PstA [uncultured Thiohalocapsa sp.]
MSSTAAAPARTIDTVNASLKRRYAAERRFRILGLTAVVLGLAFVGLLLFSIVSKGYTAFWQTYIQLPVTLTAADIDPSGVITDPDTNEEVRRKTLVRADFRTPVRDALRAQFPDVSGRSQRRALHGLISSGAALQLRELVRRDPALIGTEQTLWLVADDDVDMFMKGRSTPIDELPGAGTATPTGTTGEIALTSSADDFKLITARVGAHLERTAAALDRDIARLEGVLADLAAERADIEAAMADADGTARAKLEDRAERVDRRNAQLTRKLGRTRNERADIAAQLAAAAEGEPLALSDEMPSFLIAVNGGVVKVREATPTRVSADVVSGLDTADPAAPGTWRLLELRTPEDDRRLSDRQIAWIWQLDQRGLIETHFNTLFFTNGTSREPELAGIAAALVGSFYTLALTLLFSFPIAVGAAVYLEEFAPKNRFTDLIEVNINNLAAVPSIVFGLLGLAVFINFFGIPRSTPLVAAMVLTLMTLPTIIIASRAALKSVPPSIREAALGVGASPLQTQLHHVLPLALPGMLTGTIIGMAQALGETAPLLMIGLIAFIVDIPGGITDPATVLPVQIFMWADSPERGFVERTSAAIMILLGFLVLMNLAAVLLRRRFERRW